MFKRKFEVFFILICALILKNRNVQRAPFTSRRDNNDMWYMSEKLESIANRIQQEYK